MIGKIKRVFRIYFIWQEEKEEKWLRKMSLDGWHLVHYSFLVYTFQEGEPKDYIYKLDYKYTSDRDIYDYLNIYKDAGWERVTKFLQWNYFRADASNEIKEIYTDNDTLIRKYKSMNKVLYLVLLLNIFNLVNLILNHTYQMLNLLFILIISVVFLLLYAIYRTTKKIKSLNEEI